MLRKVRLDAAADHHAHDFIGGCSCAIEGADIFAIPQDGDAIAKPKHFGHAMGDIDHCHAAGAEILDQGKKILRIGLGERACWFIKHENPRACANGRCDLDQLLLGGGEGAHVLADIEIDADACEEGLSSPGHFPAIDSQAQRPSWIAAHAEIFGYGKVGAEREFLMNHSDPGGSGIGGR